jgi:hypothetical protein
MQHVYKGTQKLVLPGESAVKHQCCKVAAIITIKFQVLLAAGQSSWI